MTDNSYTIKILKEGFTFEQQIDELQKAKIITFLNIPSVTTPLEGAVASPITVTSPTEESVQIPSKASSGNSVVSPREYILQKKPISNSQKIATFFLYLEEAFLLPSVDKDQVKELFVTARESMPQNFSRDFDSAIRSGWISPANEQGKYYLTTTGRQVIENGFKEIIKNISHKSSKGGKKVILSIRSEVEGLDLSNTERYWALKSKGDRILWLTAKALEAGISDLNLKELSRLAEKIHDNIPQKSINALIAFNEKNGKIAMPLINDIRVLRILKPGIDYINQG